MNLKIAKLEELYANKSRHSQYQILAPLVENLVNYKKPEKSKYEKERWKYILSNVDIDAQTILDIGGNTGYFTFESCNNHTPKRVDYYEGNYEHAEFVRLATEILQLDQIIHIHPEYFLFGEQTQVWDLVLFLNVIHHIGFDFEKDVVAEMVKEKMLAHINSMAHYSKTLIFQMGFNWYGDVGRCLFEHGTKKEVEDYIVNGTSDFWSVTKIGVAVKRGNDVIYEDINGQNNVRIDEYGEFLNRPIFIMKSKLL